MVTEVKYRSVQRANEVTITLSREEAEGLLRSLEMLAVAHRNLYYTNLVTGIIEALKDKK